MFDIVLLHAYPLDSRMWKHTVALGEGVRVHTPDLPGFGPDPHLPCPKTIDDMAEAVHSYVEKKGLQRFVLGGLSMGGYVTLAYWRRYARDGGIAGLVLADTKAEADTDAAKAARDENLKVLKDQGSKALLDRLIPKMFSSGASKEAVAAARSIMEQQKTDTLSTAMWALRERTDRTSLLESIDVPTLVVCGTEDALTPVDTMKSMAMRIRTALWVPIPGAGHISNLERPFAFNAALSALLATLPRD